MKTTQYDILLSHLENRGSISGVEAAAFFRIRALPRRIKDLEDRGYVFDRVRSTDPTGQRYVRYVYRGHLSDGYRTPASVYTAVPPAL